MAIIVQSKKKSEFKPEECIIDGEKDYFHRWIEVKELEINSNAKKLYKNNKLCAKLFRCDNIYIGILKSLYDAKEKELFNNIFEIFVDCHEEKDKFIKWTLRANGYDYTENGKERCCFDYIDIFHTEKGIDVLHRNKKASNTYHIYINRINEKTGKFLNEKDIIDDFLKHIDVLKIKFALASCGNKQNFCFDRINSFIKIKHILGKQAFYGGIHEEQIYTPVTNDYFSPKLSFYAVKQ